MVRKRSRSDIRKFAMHYEQSENICQQQGWQNFPPYRDGEIIAAYQGRGHYVSRTGKFHGCHQSEIYGHPSTGSGDFVQLIF